MTDEDLVTSTADPGLRRLSGDDGSLERSAAGGDVLSVYPEQQHDQL